MSTYSENQQNPNDGIGAILVIILIFFLFAMSIGKGCAQTFIETHKNEANIFIEDTCTVVDILDLNGKIIIHNVPIKDIDASIISCGRYVFCEVMIGNKHYKLEEYGKNNTH